MLTDVRCDITFECTRILYKTNGKKNKSVQTKKHAKCISKQQALTV